MVKVFHVTYLALTFMASPPPKPENLELVAELNVDDLNKAYSMTQNDEDYWLDNISTNLHTVRGDSARSTAVGDVMEKDGIFYVVSPVGFTVLPDYEVPLEIQNSLTFVMPK